MAGSFTAVDLSRLAYPDAIEALDFETILAEMVTDLRTRFPAFTAPLESDPAFKIMEVCAYRELLIRQRFNEGIKATTLAYAMGNDLEHRAATFNVERLLLQAGDPDAIPPTADVYEDDVSLRRRVQLSFEGFSTAGPEGAYIFHALGIADVLDVAVYGPPETPGVVLVALLSRVGDGEASAELVDEVEAILSSDTIRPLTDQVTVASGTITEYEVEAELTLLDGPDSAVVMAAAEAAMEAYAATTHKLGASVTLSGIYGALQQVGVENVTLAAPLANIVTAWNEATFCTGITLTVAA